MSQGTLPFLHRSLLGVYDAAHSLALPLLGRASRLRKGQRQRRVPPDWCPAPQDLWLHAASGGEAYLGLTFLKRLAATPELLPCRVLATACTDQGLEVLEGGAAWCKAEAPLLEVTPAYFPYDAPHLMRRALTQAAPRAVVLLETELWPGFMAACAAAGVPLVLVNGRLRTRSLARYLVLAEFFRRVRPQRVLAVSEADARRFAALFGAQGVSTMPNMKFDGAETLGAPDYVHSPMAEVFRPGTSLCVLGSVREQEEPAVLAAILAVRAARPKTCIALFPRHLHRVVAWGERLTAAGVAWVPRCEVGEPVSPGTLVLWDRFGELGAAYGQARAAFVGGSLAPLGGQNILEPLNEGLIPVVGPHLENFAWAVEVLEPLGLLRRVQDGAELGRELVKYLQRPPLQTRVKERFLAVVAAHRGGTDQALAALRECLGG